MEFHDAEEAFGMRKILTHDMRIKKNSQTKEDTFWIITEFYRVYGSKVKLAPPHRNLINWHCYFLKYFVLIDSKKIRLF